MKMSNRWNQIIYRLWAPVYDSTVNQLFMPGRKRAVVFDKFMPDKGDLTPWRRSPIFSAHSSARTSPVVLASCLQEIRARCCATNQLCCEELTG